MRAHRKTRKAGVYIKNTVSPPHLRVINAAHGAPHGHLLRAHTFCLLTHITTPHALAACDLAVAACIFGVRVATAALALAAASAGTARAKMQWQQQLALAASAAHGVAPGERKRKCIENDENKWRVMAIIMAYQRKINKMGSMAKAAANSAGASGMAAAMKAKKINENENSVNSKQ